jgi:glucose/arabinose dehydrogenase
MTIKHSAAWMLAVLGLAVFACDDNTTQPGPPKPPPDADYTYDLVEAFPNLTFARPVDIRNAGDGSDRLFVVEQTGVIRVFANVDTVATSSVFLDITASVTYTSQSELGLLGLAFHPDYASNGYFYVYYTTGPTNALRARLCRFQASADPNAADPASERLMLEFAEPYANHNGGGMCFDGNGYLCLGVGDGGSGGDPGSNAQNPATLLGSILRLDVNQNINAPPYHGIPADNPFVGSGGGERPEIFAYGLRNPWRISWDAVGGRLWAGDVGQATHEEIDLIVNGGNYGWDCREGMHAYTGPPDGPSAACASASGLIDPIYEYPRSDGQSITGGYVYRGPTLTSLAGRYVYADYSGGTLFALKNTTPVQTEVLKDTSHYLSTFGIAENGELFVAAYFAAGTPTHLYRITQTEVPK